MDNYLELKWVLEGCTCLAHTNLDSFHCAHSWGLSQEMGAPKYRAPSPTTFGPLTLVFGKHSPPVVSLPNLSRVFDLPVFLPFSLLPPSSRGLTRIVSRRAPRAQFKFLVALNGFEHLGHRAGAYALRSSHRGALRWSCRWLTPSDRKVSLSRASRRLKKKK